MTAIALVSAASVGSVGGAAGPADASLERLPRPAGERYTPVVQSVLSRPRWFRGADNRFHLVYELVLTNAFPVEVTVTSVEVRDARRGRSIAMLRGDDLTASMSLLATPATPATALPSSGVGTVWLDVP